VRFFFGDGDFSVFLLLCQTVAVNGRVFELMGHTEHVANLVVTTSSDHFQRCAKPVLQYRYRTVEPWPVAKDSAAVLQRSVQIRFSKRCQRMEQTGGRHPLAHGGIKVGLQRSTMGLRCVSKSKILKPRRMRAPCSVPPTSSTTVVSNLLPSFTVLALR
jgi:hypothetical protein